VTDFPLEKDLIPFESSLLPSGPWLVMAPHPDDETLGMGGTLAMAGRKGFHVTVVFVTDGDQGGDPVVRRREAGRAAEILGISNLEFWGFLDRNVHNNLSGFTQKCMESLSQKSFETIFLPSLMEFHPDHRAVTMGGLSDEISRQAEVNCLMDISDTVKNKISAIQAYRSQTAQNAYLEIACGINRARIFSLQPGVSDAEGFWAGNLPDIMNDFVARLRLYLSFP
jgi:LmbE family N-acetylglucosaminyl deacetylase